MWNRDGSEKKVDGMEGRGRKHDKCEEEEEEGKIKR